MFYIILLATLSACTQKNEITIDIKNSTEVRIDSLQIQANENRNDQFISLEANERKKYILDMTNIIKVDGSYNMTYLINGIRKYHNFGYYTNGSPLERLVEIKFFSDTIRIERIPN